MPARDLKLLEPKFRLKVSKFLSDPRTKELDVFITETGRTKRYQNLLYSKGRTSPGQIVTWTLNSKHLIPSEAIDIACSNSKLGLYPRDIDWWNKVATVARSYGIDWGYELWGVDKPHFQDGGHIPDADKVVNYSNNVILMEELFQKQLKSIIGSISVLWHLTERKDVKDKLGEINDDLRKQK